MDGEQLQHDFQEMQLQATDVAVRAASLGAERNGWRARIEKAE
jgi:hypothetical protein